MEVHRSVCDAEIATHESSRSVKSGKAQTEHNISAFDPIATAKAEVEFGCQAAIQTLKPEPRIMRYELTDYEWVAVSRSCRTSRAAFRV